MTRDERLDGAAAIAAICAALLSAATVSSTDEAADLRSACGELNANGPALLDAGIGAPLSDALDLARQCGADLTGFGRLRSGLLALMPSTYVGRAIVRGGLVFCLVQESRVLSATTFGNADEATANVSRMNDAFAPAEDLAADAGDWVLNRALVKLHAAVTRDLVTRGSRLPRMAPYSTGSSQPSLAVANLLYADAGRADELVLQNGVQHPLFMPAAGRALSA